MESANDEDRCAEAAFIEGLRAHVDEFERLFPESEALADFRALLNRWDSGHYDRSPTFKP